MKPEKPTVPLTKMPPKIRGSTAPQTEVRIVKPEEVKVRTRKAASTADIVPPATLLAFLFALFAFTAVQAAPISKRQSDTVDFVWNAGVTQQFTWTGTNFVSTNAARLIVTNSGARVVFYATNTVVLTNAYDYAAASGLRWYYPTNGGTVGATSYWHGVSTSSSTAPSVAVTSAQIFAGTSSPEGYLSSGIGGIYNQFDATGTNFLRQWIKTSISGKTGWSATPSSTQVTNIGNFKDATRAANAYWAAQHVAAWTCSTNWAELWTSTNAWQTVGMTTNPASPGALFPDGTSPNPQMAMRFMPFSSNKLGRIVTTINLPAVSTGSGLCFVGVTTNTVPISGGIGLLGMGFDYSSGGGNKVMLWDKATSGGVGGETIYDSVAVPSSGGTYNLCISLDETNVCFSLLAPGHTNEWNKNYSRATIPKISGVFFWNSDVRGFNGVNYGPVGARAATGTIYPPGNIEGKGKFVIKTDDGFGNRIRVVIPTNFESHAVMPLIVYNHGSTAGNSEDDLWVTNASNGNVQRLYGESLVDAGFIVASSYNGGNNWGNETNVNGIDHLITWVRKHYPVSQIFMIGHSMGMLGTLNYISHHRGTVDGVIGIYPVCDLVAFAAGAGGVNYTNAIYQSFNTTNLAGLVTTSSGYNPMYADPSAFTGVPFHFYGSASDTIAPIASNSLPFLLLVTNVSPEATLTLATGQHGDSSHFQATNDLSFLARCGAVTTTNSPFAQ